MNDTTKKYFKEVHMNREEEYIETLISDCESPIEELFVTAFYSCGAKDEIEGALDVLCGGDHVLIHNTQKKIGYYRADFFIQIRRNCEEISSFVVELDGHEFHEKTKDQVIKRNERDRYLIGLGITVIHFSGSEVYNDPDGCVEKIIECIIDCELKKRKKE